MTIFHFKVINFKLMQQFQQSEERSLSVLKMNFLAAIQSKQYSEAQVILEDVLKIEPDNIGMKKFQVFLDKFKEPLIQREKEEEEWEYDDWDGYAEDEEQVEIQAESNEVDEKEAIEEGEDQGEEGWDYDYYDDEKPSYDVEQYEKQKKLFLENFKDTNDVVKNLKQTQTQEKEQQQKVEQSQKVQEIKQKLGKDQHNTSSKTVLPKTVSAAKIIAKPDLKQQQHQCKK